ncbi:unnamed protein product [Dicrocoelium dendriticum]|nr:unnamed protein product [Dicrocoelium dendriticum]
MSGENFSNGHVRPGFSFNFYRPPLQTAGCPASMSQTPNGVVAPNRNAFISCSNSGTDTHPSRTPAHMEKPIASSPVPNLTVISSGSVLPNNTIGGFQAHSVLNNLFQSLLRARVPVSNPPLTMPPANVSGYVNTLATPDGRFVPSSNSSSTVPAVSDPQTSRSSSTQSSSATYSPIPTIISTSRQPQPSNPPPPLVTRHHKVSHSSIESLFIPANMANVQLGSGKFSDQGKLQKLNPLAFVRWASACTKSFRRDRMSAWPYTQAEVAALNGMNWVVAPSCLLGIYSESPFLRPVLLLRRVQFAIPGAPVVNSPDPDNMIRTLRDIADMKVAKHPSFCPCPPKSAASVGFSTDFLSYLFTLDLDRLLVKILSDQLRTGPRPAVPEWRVVLRLGWATSSFYVPCTTPNRQFPSPRALALESLPRCLVVRVAGRQVSLPDPIFHGGQAQRLGRRLKLSIDITDKLPIKASTPIRNRFVDIEINWLHAPLEDQSVELLDMVAHGQLTPLLCHLIGLPLVQVTLDRVYTIPDLRSTFQPKPPKGSVIDSEAVDGPHKNDILTLMYNADGSMSDFQLGILGAYDNCIPSSRRITADSARLSLKSKFKNSADEDLCITDGVSEKSDYIPICLLCPLTRTRIELPVRSVSCEHLQCFDLTSYLTINRRRPRWSCPICSNSAPFRDLRLDELMMSILLDSRSETATFVHINAEGEWSLAPDDGVVDVHSPSKMDTVEPKLSPTPVLSDPQLPSVVTPLERSQLATQRHSRESPPPPTSNEPPTQPSADNDVEVIILSDDEVEARESAVLSSVEQHSQQHTHVESLISPTKKDRSEPPSNLPKEAVGHTGTHSFANPDGIQIDLTADSDDDFPAPGLRVHSAVSRADRTPDTGTSITPIPPSPVIDEEFLRNNRPLILISPLPPTVNGLSPSVDLSTTSEVPPLRQKSPPAESSLSSLSSSTSVSASNENSKVPHSLDSNRSELDPTSCRRLFDCIAQMRAEHTITSTSHTNSSTDPKKSVSRSESTNSRDKSRRLSSGNNGVYKSKTSSSRGLREPNFVRPVASYLDDPSDLNNCVPGLELSDYSDAENEFIVTTTPAFPCSSTSGRERPPILKTNQATALARLMQQRSGRQSTPATVSNTSRSTNAPRNCARRGGSTHPPNVPPASSSKPLFHKRSRRRVLPGVESEETDSSDNLSEVSSEMSCVSASDPSGPSSSSSLSKNSEEEEEESEESSSSDDRWSPSRFRTVHTTKRGKRKMLSRR